MSRRKVCDRCYCDAHEHAVSVIINCKVSQKIKKNTNNNYNKIKKNSNHDQRKCQTINDNTIIITTWLRHEKIFSRSISSTKYRRHVPVSGARRDGFECFGLYSYVIVIHTDNLVVSIFWFNCFKWWKEYIHNLLSFR